MGSINERPPATSFYVEIGVAGEHGQSEIWSNQAFFDQGCVSVCGDALYTNKETSKKIREIVLPMLDKDIHLEEIDFRPVSAQKGSGSARDMLNARV